MKNPLKSLDTKEPAFPKSTCEILKREIMTSHEAPLYQRMSMALEGLIRTGVLRPGEQLPSERNMTRQLGLSRRTVRAALGALIESKQLVPVHGKGNFIRRERQAVVDVVIPEPFLPNHWGNRPQHYQWIRDAAEKSRCAEKYIFTPDLEALDRVLQAQPNRQEGILIFRPNKEWLNHLSSLDRRAELSRLQPIMVINRETDDTMLNSVTDNHDEAVTKSVIMLADRTMGNLGLITGSISDVPFATHQKRGFVRALEALDRGEQIQNHLEISFAALHETRAAEAIASFILSRKLSGVIVAGTAFERPFLFAYRQLSLDIRQELQMVLFTEHQDKHEHPPGSICYIEPTEKVLREGLTALRKILEGGFEQPIHRRVLGDFFEIPLFVPELASR